MVSLTKAFCVYVSPVAALRLYEFVCMRVCVHVCVFTVCTRLLTPSQAYHPERYLSQPEPQVHRPADDIDYDEPAVDLDQDMGFALFL